MTWNSDVVEIWGPCLVHGSAPDAPECEDAVDSGRGCRPKRGAPRSTSGSGPSRAISIEGLHLGGTDLVEVHCPQERREADAKHPLLRASRVGSSRRGPPRGRVHQPGASPIAPGERHRMRSLLPGRRRRHSREIVACRWKAKPFACYMEVIPARMSRHRLRIGLSESSHREDAPNHVAPASCRGAPGATHAAGAKLHYGLERTQGQIAEELGLTRWKVSRLLSDARELGLVRIEIVPAGGAPAGYRGTSSEGLRPGRGYRRLGVEALAGTSRGSPWRASPRQRVSFWRARTQECRSSASRGAAPWQPSRTGSLPTGPTVYAWC